MSGIVQLVVNAKLVIDFFFTSCGKGFLPSVMAKILDFLKTTVQKHVCRLILRFASPLGAGIMDAEISFWHMRALICLFRQCFIPGAEGEIPFLFSFQPSSSESN